MKNKEDKELVFEFEPDKDDPTKKQSHESGINRFNRELKTQNLLSYFESIKKPIPLDAFVDRIQAMGMKDLVTFSKSLRIDPFQCEEIYYIYDLDNAKVCENGKIDLSWCSIFKIVGSTEDGIEICVALSKETILSQIESLKDEECVSLHYILKHGYMPILSSYCTVYLLAYFNENRIIFEDFDGVCIKSDGIYYYLDISNCTCYYG